MMMLRDKAQPLVSDVYLIKMKHQKCDISRIILTADQLLYRISKYELDESTEMPTS